MSENRKAKVFARLFGYSCPITLPEGQLQITVEWKALTGSRLGGKASFILTEVSSDDQLSEDIREQLAAHLSNVLATQIKPRDIVGYSV
jgi:hypothetical protein